MNRQLFLYAIPLVTGGHVFAKYACHAIRAAAGEPPWESFVDVPEADWFFDTFSPQEETDDEDDLHRSAFFSSGYGDDVDEPVRVVALCFAYAMKGVL